MASFYGRCGLYTTLLQTEHIQASIDHLNRIVPSINFTTEIENNPISFLDVKIIHSKDGALTTSLFQKPTHTNRYIHFQSHHPLAQKCDIANTLYHRNIHIVKDNFLRQLEDNKILETLKSNGFPEKFAC